MKQFFAIALLACIGTVGLRADFTYEQSSQITGGMIANMMKVAGVFSKSAKEPIKSTVLVKGNRMVTLSKDSAHIVDLDKETITDVNFQKKTYSVMTFAEMAEAMKKLTKETSTSETKAEIKASITDGKQTKLINGMNTKLMILAFEIESKDQKSGQSGSMVITSEMWMAPSVPGYNEVRDFQIRMAKKLDFNPGGGFAAMGGADMSKAMKGLAEESAKLEGVPVFQVTRMGMKGEPPSAEGQAAGMEGNQAPKPDASDAATRAATSSAASRAGKIGGLAGGLGGLGGFGRKKKAEEKPAPEPAPAPAPVAAPAANASPASGAPGSLMVMNSELTSFSSSADASKFDVPGGFKQVQSEMLKSGKK